MAEKSKEEHLLKVLMLGDLGVGESAILKSHGLGTGYQSLGG